jgi:hypothetical protein
MAYIIALGASSAGRGISSVICNAASNPINDRADWRRPSIHATPSTHPVSLLKSVNTNLASFFGDVASNVILITITARIDQYTMIVTVRMRSKDQKKTRCSVMKLTGYIIPTTKDSISKYIWKGSKCEDGNKDQISSPLVNLIGTAGTDNRCSRYKLSFMKGLALLIMTSHYFGDLKGAFSIVPAKKASVVTRVNQPAILVQPTQKLYDCITKSGINCF